VWEAGAKRNLIALLRPLPSITKLIRNQEEAVRYIVGTSGAENNICTGNS
jgi:hypothetical protein